MKNIVKQIKTCRESELQAIMKAIERRYAEAFPEWDVYYIALHKDPILRRQEIEAILSLGSRWPDESNSDILYFPIRHR